MKQIHHYTTIVLIFLIFINTIVVSSYGEKEKLYDVIIIGAGISGLTAADALRQLGYDVVVLEAKERNGGRLWTVDSQIGPLDMGASWIHGIKNNPINVLTEKYNIETMITVSEDHREARVIYDLIEHKEEPRLEESDEKEIINLFDDFSKYLYLTYSYIPISEIDWLTIDKVFQYDPIFRRDSFSGKTINQVLDEYIIINGFEDRRELFEGLAAYWYTNTWAANVSNISARHYGMEREYAGEEVLFPGGFKQIVDELSKEIDIRNNHVVTEIDYNGNTVTVTANKIINDDIQVETFQASYVLSTLPLGVLKDSISKQKILDSDEGIVKFKPSLPPKKIDAINKIGMGVMNKAYLIFNETDFFWEKDKDEHFITVLRDDETQWALFLNLYKYLEKPALLAFNSGEYGKKLENYTDGQIKDIALENLRHIYNDVPEPIDYKVTRWFSDPFSRGSYSYPAVHSNPSDFRELAKNVDDKLFFAGEATVPDAWGTVHGAYLSGIRVANEIDSISSWQTILRYYIIAIIVITTILVSLWIWFLKWKTKRDIALLALGKNEVPWRSTCLIAVTIIFFISAYYFSETQLGIPPDIFEHTGVWNDKCFHISKLMESIPYMKLSPEEENIYYLQYQRCVWE